MLHLPIYNLIARASSRIVSHFKNSQRLKYLPADYQTHKSEIMRMKGESNCCKQDNSWKKNWYKIHFNFNLIILIFTASLFSTLGKKKLVFALSSFPPISPAIYLCFLSGYPFFIALYGIPLYVSGSFGLPPLQVYLRFRFYKFRIELPPI